MVLNSMFHAPVEKFQFESKLELPLFRHLTRPAEDVNKLTKGLQERTQVIEWYDGET